MYQLMFFVFLYLTIFALALSLGHTKFHRLRRTIVLTKEHYSRLLELAERSLESSDIPVGAFLLYKGGIIGEGFNTVLRNAKAGEHAEVNAISAAIKDLGMEKFTMLERDSLLLATTFEPCLMCAGAFINYNIQNVFFMKQKDFSYTAKEEALFVRYLLRRRRIKSGNEQDVLFEKHPDYPQKKN
jgi:tRNA(Arg) A34 adenosine deaminase TadA